MADQDVIKEFLVGLGFKVDQKGAKDFSAGIETATKNVIKLVATIAGASLTVAAGVSAFASNLEGLYFASQRVGASAESLKAAEYAARDLGASAEDARGSIEGMAKFLRDTPGGEDFLKGLGVQTRDANHNLIDTADLLVNVGQKLKAMPWYQANQYAGVLGINESTLFAIRDDKFGAKLDQNRKKLSNSGLDQATKDAHSFMVTLREVGLQFETFSVLVQSALMRKLGPDLQRFAGWFEQNGPMIADRVADIAVKLVDFVERSIPYLQAVWGFFVKLDEATDGWSTRILALLVVLNALGVLSLVGGIARLAGSFFNLGASIAGLAGAAAVITAIAGAASLLYSPSLNNDEDEQVRKIRVREGRLEQEEQTPDQASNEDALVKAVKKLDGLDKDKATFVADFFEAQGWSKQQAAGITAQAIAESNMDPKAKGDWGLAGPEARGVFQLRRPRQDEFEKWAGFKIQDDRADLIKQLEFAQYELTEGLEKRNGDKIRETNRSSDAGAVASKAWIRPGATQEARDREARIRAAMAYQLANNASAAQRAALPKQIAGALDMARLNADKHLEHIVQASQNSASPQTAVSRYNTAQAATVTKAAPQAIEINQKTDIHVNGSSDPRATAKAVSSAQGRVGEQMARNMGSAVN